MEQLNCMLGSTFIQKLDSEYRNHLFPLTLYISDRSNSSTVIAAATQSTMH